MYKSFRKVGTVDAERLIPDEAPSGGLAVYNEALIGLSMSRCVLDILTNKVELVDVVGMSTNTRMSSYDAIKDVCKDYQKHYSRRFGDSVGSLDDWIDTTMYLVLNTRFFQFRVWEPECDRLGVRFEPYDNYKRNRGDINHWLAVNRSAFVGLHVIFNQPSHTSAVIPEYRHKLASD